MVYDGILEGRYVTLRSVTENDADFTLSVRQNPNITRYLPKVDHTIENQTAWIKKQRQDPADYFFVAWSNDKIPVGTIGIYDIKDGQAEGGRLTSVGNALQSIEIQLLAFQFDFNILNLQKVTTIIFLENERALKLSMMFGMQFEKPHIDKNGNKVCNGFISKNDFYSYEIKVSSLIYRNKTNNSAN